MLNKEEMISLLEAADSWEQINNHVKELTNGYAIINPKFNKTDYIYDVIKASSKYSSPDDASTDVFNDIVLNSELSAEEKYDRLVKS